jgi:hypothetical protein
MQTLSSTEAHLARQNPTQNKRLNFKWTYDMDV